MSSNVFDVDAAAAAFQQVVVKFRGQEYVLGGSVYAILTAASAFQGLTPEEQEGQPATVQAAAIFEQLRPILRTLNPELGKVIDQQDLNPAEEAAMLKPVTAVLEQIGSLSFRTEE